MAEAARAAHNGGMSAESRFPKSVYASGEEPDARFTLSNERTFLAWMRTAIALIACGIALQLLGQQLHEVMRMLAAVALVLTGIVLAVAAWFSWMRTERALRRDEPLPRTPLGLILSISVAVSGALLVAAMLL